MSSVCGTQNADFGVLCATIAVRLNLFHLTPQPLSMLERGAKLLIIKVLLQLEKDLG